MATPLPDSWQPALAPVLATRPLRALGGFLSAEEAAGKVIFPPRGSRLRALELTPLDAVKVVILGQDPYHGPGQAHGLSFSVPQSSRRLAGEHLQGTGSRSRPAAPPTAIWKTGRGRACCC
jgi:uracil-DNA glycosylase